MSSYGLYAGAQPGIQSSANTLLYGPALAQQAYADEYKKAAESSLIMENLRKVAAEAQAKMGDEQRARQAPERFDRAAAANYGTTLPDMAQARSMIANPESPLIEGPRWTDSPDFKRAARAVSEAEIASANPDKNTLTNFGSYRQNMAQVPGEQAKSDAITAALAAVQGGNVEGAYDIAGPILGHNPPAERNTQTQLEKLIAARDALPAGDPRRRTYDDAIRKMTTHAPGATLNAFGQPQPVNRVNPATGQRTPGMIVTDRQGNQQVLDNVEPYTPPPRTIEERIVRDMPAAGGASAPKPAAQGTREKPIAVKSKDEAAKLPPGSIYILNGQMAVRGKAQ